MVGFMLISIMYLVWLMQAVEAGLDGIRLHVFTDGRDTDPQGGVDYIDKLLRHIQPFAQVRLVSVIGVIMLWIEISDGSEPRKPISFTSWSS